MLLTSSQISMGISSVIVFTFSTLLFLSGYVLQQRTVRDLQEILAYASQSTSQQTLNTTSSTTLLDTIPWEKAAYIQVLTQYSDVCAVGMTFAELARQGSKARRILVYPREWEGSVRPKTKEQDRSLRLLRRVVVRYGISLRSVDMETNEGIWKVFGTRDEESVVLLRGTGVLYNATALDGLFLEGAGHYVGAEGEVIAAVVQPGLDSYQKLQGMSVLGMGLDEMLSAIGSEGRYDQHLFGETRTLKGILKESVAGQDEDGLLAAYMRISDPGILGPEYDIPQNVWEQARPESPKERMIWEGIYSDYRAQRMAVCGLEVEPLPRNAVLDGVDL